MRKDNIKEERILVTAAGGPSGVNALRFLSGIHHITTFATDIDEKSAGRFFASDFALMAKFRDRAAYEKSLKDLIRKWDITVVFPTLAEELAEIESVLKDVHVKVIVSPEKTVKLCDDKRELYQWMTKNFPESTARWQTADCAPLWEAENYFLKPARGRGGTGCRVISREEFTMFQKTTDNAHDWIIMEILPGTEWTVDAYVDKDGDATFIVPRERLEISSGISLKGKTVKNQKVIDLSRALLEKLRCWGPVCLQWKIDENGAIKLLEINPRLAGGAQITAAAGANPMKCLVEELAGKKPEPVKWTEKTVIGYFEYKSL